MEDTAVLHSALDEAPARSRTRSGKRTLRGRLAPVTAEPTGAKSRRPGYVARSLVLDALSFSLAALVSATLLAAPVPGSARYSTVAIGAVVVIGLAAFHWRGLYRFEAVVGWGQDGHPLSTPAVATFIISLAASQIADIQVAVLWLGASVAVGTLLAGASRSVNRRAILAACREGHFVRPALLVGTGREARDVWRAFSDHPDSGFRILGIIGERTNDDVSLPWLGKGVSDVPAAAAAFGAEAVFVIPSALQQDDLLRLHRLMAQAHIPVHVVTGLGQVGPIQLRHAQVGEHRIAYVEIAADAPARRAAKRTADLLLGVLATVAALPVMAAVSLLILFLDGRPILFRQTRVGRDLRPFTILKFRTMVRDAEERRASLQARNERQGPLFKVSVDPRVTRIGRILRSSSLDELPQLINVLLGHMSLVGPRPALPGEVDQFDEELKSRHRLRPGITGLWQVRSRDEPDFALYQYFDLHYVDHWSIATDLRILAMTVPAVVQRALLGRRQEKPAITGTRPAPADIALDRRPA